MSESQDIDVIFSAIGYSDEFGLDRIDLSGTLLDRLTESGMSDEDRDTVLAETVAFAMEARHQFRDRPESSQRRSVIGRVVVGAATTSEISSSTQIPLSAVERIVGVWVGLGVMRVMAHGLDQGDYDDSDSSIHPDARVDLTGFFLRSDGQVADT